MRCWSALCAQSLTGAKTQDLSPSLLYSTTRPSKLYKAKWVFSRKIDADGSIVEAKARILARGFGQRLAVDYFEALATDPVMTPIELVMAFAVRRDDLWTHFDVR